MTGQRLPDDARELARLIRGSTVLDPLLKRKWLSVLPHLKPADHARLRAILAGDGSTEAAADPRTPASNRQV